MRAELPPLFVFVTITCLSILSFKSWTCEIRPTSLFPSERLTNALYAQSKVFGSSEPNPSSTKRQSICIPPEDDCISSERPSANESDAINDSPPERDFILRVLPL